LIRSSGAGEDRPSTIEEAGTGVGHHEVAGLGRPGQDGAAGGGKRGRHPWDLGASAGGRRAAEQETIGPMMEQVATGEPEITFWRKLETCDEVGWE
jgi:hypothetical protein